MKAIMAKPVGTVLLISKECKACPVPCSIRIVCPNNIGRLHRLRHGENERTELVRVLVCVFRKL